MSKKELDIIDWLEQRIAFIDAIMVEACADNNYGKQVYLSAKREAYEELQLQLSGKAKKAS